MRTLFQKINGISQSIFFTIGVCVLPLLSATAGENPADHMSPTEVALRLQSRVLPIQNPLTPQQITQLIKHQREQREAMDRAYEARKTRQVKSPSTSSAAPSHLPQTNRRSQDNDLSRRSSMSSKAWGKNFLQTWRTTGVTYVGISLALIGLFQEPLERRIIKGLSWSQEHLQKVSGLARLQRHLQKLPLLKSMTQQNIAQIATVVILQIPAGLAAWVAYHHTQKQ